MLAVSWVVGTVAVESDSDFKSVPVCWLMRLNFCNPPDNATATDALAFCPISRL
jgi:hypothetical protein